MDPFEYFRARMRDDLLKLTLTQNLEMFRIMLAVICECKMLVRKLERFLRKYLVVQLTQLKDARSCGHMGSQERVSRDRFKDRKTCF